MLCRHIEGRTYAEFAALLQRHAESIDDALQRSERTVQEHLDPVTRDRPGLAHHWSMDLTTDRPLGKAACTVPADPARGATGTAA